MALLSPTMMLGIFEHMNFKVLSIHKTSASSLAWLEQKVDMLFAIECVHLAYKKTKQ